jgi:alkyl sulfatase BDS1-like metallo-beta-lactamase superfamily hydrolase
MESFEKRIVKVGRVHCALGYGLANSSMIAVENGYVVVDTLPILRAARPLRQEFDQRVPGGVAAVIYTHFHTDHVSGTTAFAEPGVPIWAHERCADELGNVYRLSRSTYRRAARQFGMGLEPGLVQTCGVGPPLELDEGPVPPTMFPTHTFRDVARLEIGGVRIELHAAPGETPDQLFIWLPDDRILLAADNIYRGFPNMYAIRGARPRPVAQWIQSLDRMRRLDPAPEFMVLGHTEPVQGAKEIYQVLTDYRDAIAFVHDSVIRMINEERTPDDMVRAIQLPAHLRDHPYLVEVYGTLEGAIRGIYAGYVGWFDGNSANLSPPHSAEIGTRLVGMLGAPRLLKEIETALAGGDLRWALWLSDRLLAADPDNRAATERKLQGLNALADRTTNPLMRNWYLTEAAELDGRWRFPDKPPINSQTTAELPIECIMAILPQRLDPREAEGVTTTFGFEFTDSKKEFTFFVRRGVGEIVEHGIDSPDLLLRVTEHDFKRIFIAREVAQLSAEFWKSLELVVPGPAALAPLKKINRLALLGRIMRRP